MINNALDHATLMSDINTSDSIFVKITRDNAHGIDTYGVDISLI